VRFELTLPRT